jgi:hypothetical protein
MKMRTISWSLSIGLRATREGVVEVNDDATDDEIEEMVNDTVMEFVEFSWKEEQ